MLNFDGSGLCISDGRSGIEFYHTRPEWTSGSVAAIHVQIGEFGGSVTDHTIGGYGVPNGFEQFRGELIAMHERLTGMAYLVSYNGMSLIMSCRPQGIIDVEVDLDIERIPSAHLRFEFKIDQSYLPKIIAEIDAEFQGSRKS